MPEAPEVKSPLCLRTTADRHVQSLPAGGVGRPRIKHATANLADFLVRQIEDRAYVRETPVLLY